MSGDESEADFWPGYVAASAGLVQALLVVTMALGISIYAVDQLADLADIQELIEAEQQDAQNRLSFGSLDAEDGGIGSSIPFTQFDNLTASGETEPRIMQDFEEVVASADSLDLNTDLKSSLMEQIEPNRLATTALTESANEQMQDAEAVSRAETYISITFIGDAVEIPSTSAAEIVNALSLDAVSSAYKWRVVVPSYSNEPRASRAGYLRLVGLRSVLMDAGVPADRIELDFSEEFQTVDPGSVVTLLIPYDDNGLPLRQAVTPR